MDPPLTTGASDALGNLIKTKFTLIICLIIIDNLCTHTYVEFHLYEQYFSNILLIRNNYIYNIK